LVSSVLDAASERSVSVEALAHAKDKNGRLAIDVATLKSKRCFWKRMFILGRYQPRRRLHQSGTSQVWEVEDKEATDESRKRLALKQIEHEVNFLREMSIRQQFNLSDKFVVQVIETVHSDRIMIMPYCECSLEHAISNEHFAGMSAEIVRSAAKQLAVALRHVHSMGVVHGDLKPKNICRFNGVWKLIDFDAAIAIGGAVGLKVPGTMPANMPPEQACRVFRSRFSASAIRARLNGLLDLAERADWDACLAIVAQLDREGLGPQTCSISDVAPSFDMWGLGLILYRLFTAFRLFNHDEHDELEEKELCRLVVWRGNNESEVRKRIFASAEPGAVSCSEKDCAEQLISECLQADPKLRPQSLDELLKFEYFLPRGCRLKAKILFVSTPGKGLNPKTCKYDFDVMGWLQKLCRHFAGRLVVAYDWAGSSSVDSRDTEWFDRIFTVRNAEGQTLFEEWMRAPTAEQKDKIIDDVEKLLHETRWLSAYKGSIKAQIRETCQSGAKAILVRIEGGPITRVEARLMLQLITESRADLAQLGVSQPSIELFPFETVHEFAGTALANMLVDIDGESCEPIPASLLAEIEPGDAEAQPSPIAFVADTRVNHTTRGAGRVTNLNWDDPRGKPIYVHFDNGEVHHYDFESAAKKLRLELWA
jgi:serine/threonine protein kinase